MKFFVALILISTSLWASSPVDKLKEIVLINSGSSNIAGVKKVMMTVKPWYEDLGFKVTLVNNPKHGNKSAPLFMAEKSGEKDKFITFVMHADTVFEPGSPFQKITMKSKSIMQGPGVIDNKGGIIVGHLALQNYLKDIKKPKYGLRVVITPSEEVGSDGFQEIIEKFSQTSWLVLGLEPANENGGPVIGRKGNVWVEIEVKGKEAHAGRAHAEGVNACHILSNKVAELQKLTNYETGLTVSVGRMEGGQDKFNIVCGWARAKMDTRIPNFKIKKELLQNLDKILKAPNINFKIVDDTPPFSTNKVSAPIIEKYLGILNKIEGISPKGEVSSGVGDLNVFSREGLAILDGLGPRGGDLHTENEWINLESIEKRAQALTELLKSL